MWVGAAGWVLVDDVGGEVFGDILGDVLADLAREGDDIDRFWECFEGDCAADDAAEGFAAGGAAAASVVAVAEFVLPDAVGMAGSEVVGVVILAALVGILDDDADGGAEGFVFENAAEDLGVVGFGAAGSDGGLAWPAAIEVILDVGCGEVDACGAAVDDGAQGGTVGFAEGGEAEEISEGVCGHGVGGVWSLGCGVARASRENANCREEKAKSEERMRKLVGLGPIGRICARIRVGRGPGHRKIYRRQGVACGWWRVQRRCNGGRARRGFRVVFGGRRMCRGRRH